MMRETVKAIVFALAFYLGYRQYDFLVACLFGLMCSAITHIIWLRCAK